MVHKSKACCKDEEENVGWGNLDEEDGGRSGEQFLSAKPVKLNGNLNKISKRV